MRQIFVRLAVIAIQVTSVVASAGTVNAATDGSWFQPTLTTKNDAVCDAILAGARTQSSDYHGLTAVPSFSSDDDRGNSSVQSVPGRIDYLLFAQHGTKPLYVERIRNPGCGGACESESLGLRATAPSGGDQAGPSTPPSESWDIYETTSGRQFVVGVVDRQLEVYSPSPSAGWQLACRVQLEPDLDHSADPHVQQANASLQALRVAVENMARDDGYGMCGTMHTASRWSADFQHALAQVLFDPDSTGVADQLPSENSYGDYPRIYAALQEWSLGGIIEHRALQQYDAQLQATTAVVKDFYQYAFHWSAARSLQMAQLSIPRAVSHRFGFYMYTPHSEGEGKLRRALLTHQPMAAVRAIDVAVKALDEPNHDSILNVAVEYPEALSYLLTQGADPNRANEFGKTPLMYAVQYNQLQSVRILLEARADPNAATTVPPDDCLYALQKQRVTALHYAVRYAGRVVIQALLDAGATTLIKTEHYIDPSQGSYAIEWLDGSNANLSPDDVRALRSQLAVPGDADRSRRSIALSAEAARQNAVGNATGAYRAIKLALWADPKNRRAIADFPLLALKAGAIGPALEGAARALSEAKTPTEQAAAHFNQGLACEHATDPIPTYNNQRYCQGGYLEQFILAWRLEPTPARSGYIVHLFDTVGPRDCSVAGPDGAATKYRILQVFDENVAASAMIYGLHAPSVIIDPSLIEWQETYTRQPGATKTHPHLIETLQLDKDHSLTVLEDPDIPDHVAIQGYTCGAQ